MVRCRKPLTIAPCLYRISAVVLLLTPLAASAGSPSLLGAFTTGIDASDVVLLSGSSNVCVAGSRFQKNFQVIGVTNPVAPAFVSRLVENDVSGDRVTLSDDHSRAYMVGFFGGMKIVALDNPGAPAQLGTYGVGGARIRDVAVTSDRRFAFVADESDGIQVVILTNEALPVLVGQYQNVFSNRHNAAGLALSDDDMTLYVAAEDGGLVILSVTNPPSPTQVGHFTRPPGSGGFTGVHLSSDGRIAYAVGGEGNSDEAFRVISVTNPAAPTLLSGYADPQRGESFADVAMSPDGTTAFLVGRNVGLQVVDVSRETSVFYVSEFHELIDDVAPQATGVALSEDGNTAYIAQHGSGMRVVDVSGVYDVDDDGLPNWWEVLHFNSVTSASPTDDGDGDNFSNREEFIAGTNPDDVQSLFRIEDLAVSAGANVSLDSVSGRRYDLLTASALASNTVWVPVVGATNRSGNDAAIQLSDTNASPRAFYRVNVRMAD